MSAAVRFARPPRPDFMARRLRFIPTLRGRLLTIVTLLSLLTTVVVTLVLAHDAARVDLDIQKRAAQDLMETFAAAIRNPTARAQWLAPNGPADRIAVNPMLADVRVLAASDGALYEREGAREPLSWFARALLGNDADIRRVNVALGGGGRIEATLANRPINDRVAAMMLKGGGIGAALFLVTLALAHVLLGRFTTALKPLTEWAREFSRGNWRPMVKLLDADTREIAELNRAFTDGAAALRHYVGNLSETRELLEHNETQLRKLIEGMHEILFELDVEGRLVFLNPAWEKLTGFAIADSLDKAFADFMLDEDATRDVIGDWSKVHERSRELTLRTAAGPQLWVSMDADAQFDTAGNFTGVIGTLDDITKTMELNRLLSRYQDELYHMSVTDPLTGLYNRRHFDTQLEVILSDHLSDGRSVCLLLIDLDGFKFINDTYGHPFGDEVLKTTAHLLRQQVRRNDYIARLAGDEFAMVLKNTNLESATRIAQKLHATIHQTRVPLPVGDMQLQSSIGVAEAPIHGKNAQDLVSAADVALYHSKRHGRNRVEALSPDMSQAMMSIFSQGFQLRSALDQGRIYPVFQPIVSMHDDQSMAYEVLARMKLNDTVIQAKDFITVAEELGLTRDVDLHIIRSALAITPVDWVLFLNVDLSSFNDPGFVQELGRLLQSACAGGRRITIEITEREVIPLSPTLHQDIQRLREFGCKLALDDFGSGYSTYNFLNQFRPDYLKIEGSFVRGMLKNESDRKIVTHIHELATSFGMETIAESVEDEATRDVLRAIGISNGQGYWYGMPQRVPTESDAPMRRTEGRKTP